MYVSKCPKFETEDIRNRLKKLDVTKSPGPEGIHPKILHEIADQIAYPLQLMFDCSFTASRMEVCKYNSIVQERLSS